MAAGSTYTPIATYTVSGSSTTSFTFSSIPSTYTDLVLIVNAKYSVSDTDFFIRFNSDSGSNYSITLLYGNGSSAGSHRVANATYIEAGAYGYPGVDWTSTKIDIQNYSNTNTYKTVLSRADAATGGTRAIAGLWRNTSAISSVTVELLTYLSPTFVAGSTFTLYGIQAA